jgi:uncharacterized protein YjbJ (UPF0337 family)
MTDADRAGHKIDEYTGKAKEFVGERSDNPDLAEEGREDQAESKVKQVGDDVKDAVGHAKDVFHK